MLLVVSLVLQLVQQPAVIRGGDCEITVPYGWKALIVGCAAARLEHSAGASLRISRPRPSEDLDSFVGRAAERLATPLGFAKIAEPRHFRDSSQEWFEYDIRGNRLSERRRILYRAIRNESGLVEIVYENSEERFEVLLSDALSIASSLKSVPRKVRVRQK